MKYYIPVLLCLLLCQCHNKFPSRVADKYPIGSPLTLEILKEADQIIQTDTVLIILLDCSIDKGNRYDPYLLFFDKNNKLYAASYFPAQKVDSIKNGQIYASLNESRANRDTYFEKELPPGYSTHYLVNDPNGAGTNSSKIIDSLYLDDELHLRLFIREIPNRYSSGYDINTNVTDPAFNNKFTVKDTLEYPLSILLFQRKGFISNLAPEAFNHYMYDEMLAGKPELLDNFFKSLYAKLKKHEHQH